jgi:ureidoglycolate lyase
MKKIKVKELSLEGFRNYGTFANMLKPELYGFGELPIQFFRDMLQLSLGVPAASFSVNVVAKRPFIITKTEFHSHCGEGILPLDNDILIHCGPATRNGVTPFDQFEVFRVPKGTMVCLKPGVWHHAPFALTDQPAHILVVLPERTYANDCAVVELAESERIEIAV